MRTADQRERGAVIPLVALLLPMLIVITAIAVDLGRQRSDRRLAQAGADVVALDMIRIVEGRTLDQVLSDPATSTALSESAERNGFTNAVGFVVDLLEPHISKIEWGVIPGDDDDAAAFVALDPLVAADLDEVPTAVRITAERTTDYFFQPGEKGVTRVAVATQDKVASFQLGTRLISIDSTQSALLNAVLTATLGGAVNTSVVGYQGLVGAQINLADLATQLGFGSPSEMADATVNARDFYLAGAQVLENQGNTAGAEAFEAAALAVDGSTTLDMGGLMDVEQGGPADAANASVDAFSLLTGSAYLINGTSTINVPSLGVTIPNVVSTTMALNVTEGVQIASGRIGTFADTRQVSLTLTSQLDVQLTPLLRTVGTVTTTVEIAGGRGTLTDIDCGRPGISVGLAPRPVTATQTMDLSVRTLLGIPVVRSTGTSASAATQGTSNGASFDHPTEFLPDVGTGTMVPSNTTTLGIANAANVSTGNLTLLGVLPLGTTLGTVAAALNTLLNPILTALDALVVNQMSSQLGINVGGADIGAIDMSCRSVKLVG